MPTAIPSKSPTTLSAISTRPFPNTALSDQLPLACTMLLETSPPSRSLSTSATNSSLRRMSPRHLSELAYGLSTPLCKVSSALACGSSHMNAATSLSLPPRNSTIPSAGSATHCCLSLTFPGRSLMESTTRLLVIWNETWSSYP